MPAQFDSDGTFLDKTVVGQHQLYRHIQSTNWSRKRGLAGRSIEDPRVVEVARKGVEEFGLRLLSEGTPQNLVFTRSVGEAAFVTSLLKKLRENRVDIDTVEATFHPSSSIPDKQNEAIKYMQPVVDNLSKQLSLRMPKEPEDSDAQQQILKYEEKMRQAGIEFTPPSKHTSQELPDEVTELPPNKKSRTLVDVPLGMSHLVTTEPVRKIIDGPEGSTDQQVDDWLLTFKSTFKGKFGEFKKHVKFVQDNLKSHVNRSDMQKIVKHYGLPSGIAGRLNQRNLSSVIAAAQFKAAWYAWNVCCSIKLNAPRSEILSEILGLGQAITFFIHEIRDVAKEGALWAQGLLHLVLLFHFADLQHDTYAARLVQRLQEMKICARDYTFDQFSHPTAVYVK